MRIISTLALASLAAGMNPADENDGDQFDQNVHHQRDGGQHSIPKSPQSSTSLTGRNIGLGLTGVAVAAGVGALSYSYKPCAEQPEEERSKWCRISLAISNSAINIVKRVKNGVNQVRKVLRR